MADKIGSKVRDYAARHPWRAALIYFALIPAACLLGWLLIKIVIETPDTTFLQKVITLFALTVIAFLIGLAGFRLTALANRDPRRTPNLLIVFATIYFIPGLLFGAATIHSPGLIWRPGLGMPWLYFWQNIILLIILLRERDHAAPTKFDRRVLIFSLFLGAGVGICSAFVIGLLDSISLVSYHAPQLSPVSYILIMFVSIFVAPLAAEMVFRKRLLDLWQPSWGFTKAMLASSIVYAFLQLRPLVILPAFILGCCLSWLYWYTKKLVYPIIAHLVFNILMLVLGWWLVV
jgi:membrane protease YdiL (CAAX protease family)